MLYYFLSTQQYKIWMHFLHLSKNKENKTYSDKKQVLFSSQFFFFLIFWDESVFKGNTTSDFFSFLALVFKMFDTGYFFLKTKSNDFYQSQLKNVPFFHVQFSINHIFQKFVSLFVYLFYYHIQGSILPSQESWAKKTLCTPANFENFKNHASPNFCVPSPEFLPGGRGSTASYLRTVLGPGLIYVRM